MAALPDLLFVSHSAPLSAVELVATLSVSVSVSVGVLCLFRPPYTTFDVACVNPLYCFEGSPPCLHLNLHSDLSVGFIYGGRD